MKVNHKNQYTIRNLPPELDKTLRQNARKSRKSLNSVVLETLSKGAGLVDKQVIHHDLDKYIGTWVDDPVFEEVRAWHERIDEDMWK